MEIMEKLLLYSNAEELPETPALKKKKKKSWNYITTAMRRTTSMLWGWCLVLVMTSMVSVAAAQTVYVTGHAFPFGPGPMVSNAPFTVLERPDLGQMKVRESCVVLCCALD